MNQRDLKNYRNWDDIWEEEFEKEFGYTYMDDKGENIKNK